MSRKISWLSAIDPINDNAIQDLEKKLSDFYANNSSYYSSIDYTAGNWDNKNELAYQQIKDAARKAVSIGEIGCGAANILASDASIRSKYVGCDFSAELMKKNKEKYPEASFKVIETPNLLPFADNSFDLLFSVFVLEHITRPHILLKECQRVLKKGGRLIIFCPDFLGRGGISSQQIGWTEGTPSQKLKKGKLLDTLVTFYDSRIRIPFYSSRKRKANKPAFLINVDPTVFYYKFRPDVDAVYLTHRKEIITFLAPNFDLEPPVGGMPQYEKERKLIFVSFVKK